jgi:hypothetical protein
MADQLHPAFFGYGSLVNRATHAYEMAMPARLTGWRRIWRQTTLRPFAFLSAEPATGQIDGLIAAVPGDDWAALDEREVAYLRHPLAPADLDHAAFWAATSQIYAVDPAHHDRTANHPILLSYLDVVIQGFLREFGESGVNRFMESTDGWACGLHDDRARPLYPRHQILSGAETALVDRLTSHLPRVRATV